MQLADTLASSERRRIFEDLRGDRRWRRAWHGYRGAILDVASRLDRPRLIEVGGGRSPLLTEDEVAALGCDYTVNDIDANELARAPSWVTTLHGDIAAPGLAAVAGPGSYDLVFAKLVFEHVRDPENAYRNIATMLRPGGIFVNLIPTLYAAPFVVNRLMPEELSARVLRWAMPNRNDDEVPKFPAYYRWCTSSSRTGARVRSVGFSHCLVLPFYGHTYYRKIPGLRTAADRFTDVASRREWRSASTFAYVVCER